PSGPITRLPLPPSGGAGATVHKSVHGDVTLVTISGRLTEAFKGEALGRELQGSVAIDLAAIERVTSFGVREWLSMLGAMQGVRRLYLMRASEAVANQLSMIRKFSGNGQIVSFFAPYLCGGCGEPFERQLDCERDGEAIREGDAADATCPRCEGAGRFDDDARSYFAFATPHLLTPVPEEIRALHDALDAQPAPAPRDAVDKTVEGNQTRVRVNSKLAASIRWRRIFDGIEGSLVLDLGGVTGVEAEGAANLEQALSALGPEVSKIVLERAPAQVVELVAKSALATRASIASALVEAHCRTCAVLRSAVVSLREHGDALAAGGSPRVHCKRCNGELDIAADDRTIALLRAQLAAPQRAQPSTTPPTTAAELPASVGGMSLGAPRAAVDVAAPAGGRRRSRSAAIAVAIATLGVLVVALGARELTRPSPATSAAAPPAPSASEAPAPAAARETAPEPPSTAWMQSVDLPPAWVERPFVIEGGDVLVVGRGELSATPEQAMGLARADAVVRMMRQVLQELAGSPAAEFLQERVRDASSSANDAVAARYLKQLGTTASPERVDAALRKRESGVEGFARYKLSRETYQRVVASYRETASLQGMTVGRFFPLLETTMHSEGDLVVFSVARGRPALDQGVRPGDVVLSIGGRAVSAPDAFGRVSSEEWAATPARGTLSVEVESAGARRTVRFFKPAPPNP
ncbi:MAG: hypothetical protein KF782_35295, partial [Labilithrix sp.]|nr:hypothetical protein [Labilithrix sp.]